MKQCEFSNPVGIMAAVGKPQELGWTVDRDLTMDYRAAGRDPDRYRRYAEELVALRPDVLVAGGTARTRGR